MTLARSVALQEGAPEPCLRRAPGAPPYATEGGAPEQAQTLRGLPPEGLGLAMSSSSWERSQGASRSRDLGFQVMQPEKLVPGSTLRLFLHKAP